MHRRGFLTGLLSTAASLVLPTQVVAPLTSHGLKELSEFGETLDCGGLQVDGTYYVHVIAADVFKLVKESEPLVWRDLDLC